MSQPEFNQVDLASGREVRVLTPATTVSHLSDVNSRKLMVYWIGGLFLVLNIAAMALVLWAFCRDAKLPISERLITTHVLLTLIGATIVQNGVGLIAILGYLFPKNSTIDSQEN